MRFLIAAAAVVSLLFAAASSAGQMFEDKIQPVDNSRRGVEAEPEEVEIEEVADDDAGPVGFELRLAPAFGTLDEAAYGFEVAAAVPLTPRNEEGLRPLGLFVEAQYRLLNDTAGNEFGDLLYSDLTANLALRGNGGGRFQPYVGGGGGISWLRTNVGTPSGFVGQGFAGFTVPLGEDLARSRVFLDARLTAHYRDIDGEFFRPSGDFFGGGTTFTVTSEGWGLTGTLGLGLRL